MGELICLKCKATQEADTFEQADEKILHKGNTCNASQLNMTWDKNYDGDERNPKPVASVVIHFGPGSEGFKAPGARKPRDKKPEPVKEKSESKPSPKENTKSSSTKAN